MGYCCAKCQDRLTYYDVVGLPPEDWPARRLPDDMLVVTPTHGPSGCVMCNLRGEPYCPNFLSPDDWDEGKVVVVDAGLFPEPVVDDYEEISHERFLAQVELWTDGFWTVTIPDTEVV